MMVHYGGFPAFDLMYDTGGHLVDPAAEDEALNYLGGQDSAAITDIAVISHGWNNDISEARVLYSNFFSALQSVVPKEPRWAAANRQLAVIAVFWPSKRFVEADLIPGGAAGLADGMDAKLNAQLDILQQLYAGDPAAAGKVQHARDQIAKLEVSQSAQDDFVFALKSMLPPPRGERDEGLDDAREQLDHSSSPGHAVLSRLSVPVFPVMHNSSSASGGAALALAMAAGGGTVGGAANIFTDIGSGIKAGASRLLNLFTYYTMKDRAGIVGRTGAAQTVAKIQAASISRTAAGKKPLKIHLMGHSFGGRLVTSVANALAPGKKVDSILLLQAAYSHNGMAKNWDSKNDDGAFRAVAANPNVAGPMLITHSVHDQAVGLAYPLASRLMNQVAAAIGDANDPFGGMGRNGAQHTPEAFDDFLGAVEFKYQAAAAGKFIRNLNADGPTPKPTITGHSDVAKPEIAWAWLNSVA